MAAPTITTTTTYDGRYVLQWMPNGLLVLFDRRSGLRGTYTADGTYRHGDLRQSGIARQLAARLNTGA